MHACGADAARATAKVVDAAMDGKPTPKINVRIFGAAADGADDFTEVVMKGGKPQVWKNGKFVDVDRTMRGFIKDPSGRRIHSFFASAEDGQKAVNKFFKGVSSGPVDPAEAKRIGNAFQKMSEVDQATLVGGIENKLRAGQQITEAEFLIAVKGTPSFRTLPNATPHLADLQKAFRSGDLGESLAIISKSWDVQNVSAKTQGQVARIGGLLGQQKLNKAPAALTDVGSGQKLLPTIVKNGDEGTTLPAVVGKTDTPPVVKPPKQLPGPGAADDMPAIKTPDAPSRPVVDDTPPKGPRKPASDGDGEVLNTTKGEDGVWRYEPEKPGTSVTLKSNSTPDAPPKTTAIVETPPKQPKAPKKPTQPKLEGPPPQKLLPATAPKLTKLQRAKNWVKNNKGKVAIGMLGLTAIGNCVLYDKINEDCMNFLNCMYLKVADPDEAKKVCDEKAYLSEMDTKVVKSMNDDGTMSCEIFIKSGDKEISYEEMKENFTADKAIKIKWTPTLVKNGKIQDEATYEDVLSKLGSDAAIEKHACEDDDNHPVSPCVVKKSLINKAKNHGYHVQYTLNMMDDEGQILKDKTKTNCTTDDGSGVNPGGGSDDNDDSSHNNDNSSESDDDDSSSESDDDDGSSLRDCEITNTCPEDSDEDGDRTPSGLEDPFNILQGNDGKKYPLTPPNPIQVPPDNFPPYVTPGYY